MGKYLWGIGQTGFSQPRTSSSEVDTHSPKETRQIVVTHAAESDDRILAYLVEIDGTYFSRRRRAAVTDPDPIELAPPPPPPPPPEPVGPNPFAAAAADQARKILEPAPQKPIEVEKPFFKSLQVCPAKRRSGCAGHSWTSMASAQNFRQSVPKI